MHDGKRITLDPRLSMIARLAGRCERFADIGCDHGRLGAFMLQTGRCRRAVLTDISEPSLAKARTLIALLGLSEQTEFRTGDGLAALNAPADVVVIAGMGGPTIARIIEAGCERLASAKLILQPNVGAPVLRRALSDIDRRITDERVVQDGRRNYVIIAAEPGHSEYDERQLIVGPVLLDQMPKELLPYALFRLRVAKKALAGARSGNDDVQMSTLRKEIAIWEDVSACLRR